MINLAEWEHCTGCGVCNAICPVQAITMQQSDEDGFYRPYIEKNICVKCGKCEAICPELHSQEKRKTYYYGRVYAAINKEDKIRYDSTSGGVFAALSSEIIKRGGCVAGAAYNENLDVVHILANNMQELKGLFQSKYLQSNMANIYKEVSQKLAEGKEVLFCGTPCQVAGIKRYIEEKKLEEKLITVDLLCRGVPSPKTFHKYLEMIEETYHKKVVSVKFKDKEKGWHNLNTRIVLEDGSECYLPGVQCTFVGGFINDNMTIRESCFYCSYKKLERQGDITIGDFWGLKNTKLEDDKGTSAVIINSIKGSILWDQIKYMLLYKESSLWRVVRGNRMAFNKLPENLNRKQFWEYLKIYNFDKALSLAVNNEQIRNEV